MKLLALALLAGCTAEPTPTPERGGQADVQDSGPAGDTDLPDEDEEPSDDDDVDTDEDTDGDTDTDTDTDDGLLGIVLDPPLDPPEFEVLAADGTPRTPDWFTGDPSVVWFFRDTGAT